MPTFLDYNLSKEQAETLLSADTLIPFYKEIFGDTVTPVSVYMALRKNGIPSFLLESVVSGDQIGRYSFIGTHPIGVWRFRNDGVCEQLLYEDVKTFRYTDPLKVLEDHTANYKYMLNDLLPRFTGGLVGYLAYESSTYFEKLPRANGPSPDTMDAFFVFVDTMAIFDHVKNTVILLTHLRGSDGNDAFAKAIERIEEMESALNVVLPPRGLIGIPEQTTWLSNTSKDEFVKMVEAAKEYILAGDIYQVVLSQRWTREYKGDAFSIYRALRSINPSPYMYFIDTADWEIAGSSPEVLVSLVGKIASTRPLAGTRRRGYTPSEDSALQKELLADEKERAEHVMLVDLGRNDLGRVCRPGSVKVTQLMGVERYSHVMHMVSHVEGELENDRTAFDLLRSCFPAGTVSGAPKLRAMEIIAELEKDKRGFYSGAVGYIGLNGNMDMAIGIRSVLVKDGSAYVQSGAGLVADSDPDREFQETLHKAKGMMDAVNLAEAMIRS